MPYPKITAILKDTKFSLNAFKDTEIELLENSVIQNTDKKGNPAFAVDCLKRGSTIKLTPEEVVRQLFLNRLFTDYKYPKNRILVEFPVRFGTDTSKRADIVIMEKDRPDAVYIIVELKKPTLKDGKEQLKSYCNGTGSPMGVWTNGGDIDYYHRKDPNIFDKIGNIPAANETLEDVLNTRFTIWHLIANDKLKEKSLKKIIEEFEDEVLANAGVDVFEEAFKLIFTKLYDEQKSTADKLKISNWLEFNDDKKTADIPQKTIDTFRNLEFRNRGIETATKAAIDALFEEAKNKWAGIFTKDSKIELIPSHLQTCVSYLEKVKLFNSNLEVVDEAFEYLVNKDSKGDKGQYFTPRYVIDMGVKMLNPKADEYMIDTAAGSSGFPVHTVFHVWEQLNKEANRSGAKHFTLDTKTPEQIKYVQEKVFAIDFDFKAVRVGKTLNLIAGDGETNVLHLNTLDFPRWEMDNMESETWKENFFRGFQNLKKLARKKGDFRYFDFDVLLANPPFAGDIKDQRVIHLYEVARKTEERIAPTTKLKLSKDKGWHDKISRDILFIERNLDMLKDGGRMAVVLPQGRFNNSSDKAIRQYIAARCRILGVVGLHGNSFKPHTGTKTSVLFVQKWHAELCPKTDNYNIFFATQQKEGKNNSGDKLFWADLSEQERARASKSEQERARASKSEQERARASKSEQEIWQLQELPNLNLPNKTTTEIEKALLDRFGHPIVYHDLYSTPTQYEGISTPPGIAEAFEQFCKKEALSFF
jgi:type I restriction enzyme M protein